MDPRALDGGQDAVDNLILMLDSGRGPCRFEPSHGSSRSKSELAINVFISPPNSEVGSIPRRPSLLLLFSLVTLLAITEVVGYMYPQQLRPGAKKTVGNSPCSIRFITMPWLMVTRISTMTTLS